MGDGPTPSFRGIKQYYVYIAMGQQTKSKVVGGMGRREANNTTREWKLEALADVLEDFSFENGVSAARGLAMM